MAWAMPSTWPGWPTCCRACSASTVRPTSCFTSSGVDVLATDKLGHLALDPRTGCRRRDELVLTACATGAVPTVVCMGGGYSARIGDIVEAHANTYRVAANLWDWRRR
ncbi:MAG: hypothetical protein WKG07_09465 [Hymenobacter sp.]